MSEQSLVSVVDDDESIRESLPDLLRQLGFAAEAFSSAETFLASEVVSETSCLILDVAMPGMSGPDLQQELIRRRQKIPIVFITANGDRTVGPRLLAQGAAACLFKPFGEAALLRRAERRPPNDVNSDNDGHGKRDTRAIYCGVGDRLPFHRGAHHAGHHRRLCSSSMTTSRYASRSSCCQERWLEARDFVRRRISCPARLTGSVLPGPRREFPGLSGLDLQTRLGERGDMPIIFITGHGDVPMSVRAMKAGAVEFLTKPLSDDALLAAVEGAIERSREALDQAAELRLLCANATISLSPREREVMALVVSGLLNKQVGGELGISEITVKAHRGQVMGKMQAARFLAS